RVDPRGRAGEGDHEPHWTESGRDAPPLRAHVGGGAAGCAGARRRVACAPASERAEDRRAPAGGGVDPGMIGHDDWARRVLNDASVHPLARFVNRWQVRVVSAIGGEGKESNLPSPTRRDKPVLKTGGATGPLPSPRDDRALNVAARRRVAKT